MASGGEITESTARLAAQAGRHEGLLRRRFYPGGAAGPIAPGARVRITGLSKAPELNGRHGNALGPVNENGLRHVILEGAGAASVALRDCNLQPAPPAPADTEYANGGFRLKAPSSGLPRRCRAGSGAPSYSTRAPLRREAPPPPQAGALLARHDPPAAFAADFRDGSLPVRLAGAGAGEHSGLKWIDPLTGVEVPRHEIDASKWLPRLLEGLRDTRTTSGAYLALRAALELAGGAARNGALPPLVTAAVPSLRAALELRERSVVCAALKLLQLLIRADGRAGLALRPHFRGLLPSLAAFKVAGAQANLGDEIEYSQHRRIDISTLIDETLALMEEHGGKGAGAAIKSFVPTFQPADEVLHRGFR